MDQLNHQAYNNHRNFGCSSIIPGGTAAFSMRDTEIDNLMIKNEQIKRNKNNKSRSPKIRS